MKLHFLLFYQDITIIMKLFLRPFLVYTSLDLMTF